MAGYHQVDIRSAGRKDLALALRLGFRDRVATHVCRDRLRGLVFFDFREPGTSYTPNVVKLAAPVGPDEAFDLAVEWLDAECTWKAAGGALPFRVHCSEGGRVINEDHAFLAVNALPKPR